MGMAWGPRATRHSQAQRSKVHKVAATKQGSIMRERGEQMTDEEFKRKKEREGEELIVHKVR